MNSPLIAVEEDDVIDGYWSLIAEKEGLRFRANDSWDTSRRPWPILSALWSDAEVLRQVEHKPEWTAILRVAPDALVHLHCQRAWVRVAACASDQAVASGLVEQARQAVPRPKAKADGIDVRFWYLTSSGPQNVRRVLAAPAWDAIRGNYAPRVAEHLTRAATSFVPSHGGQIILWHGKAGTGKTWALRALLREWRAWCSAEYVLDPENLFGEHSAYLVQMLLGAVATAPKGTSTRERWKLLILEDTGELVSEDAKARSGHGLSRLLNLADGFIGQGLRVLVLITTNEELHHLHPAVSRPGRAASVVQFTELPVAQANEWLRARDLAGTDSQMTLADLYARMEQFEDADPVAVRPVGFAR